MIGLERIWHRLSGDRNGRLRAWLEWEALPDSIKNAERFDGLSEADDFIAALDELPSDARDRETHLRLRLWWASNDHCRVDWGGELVEPHPVVGPGIADANKMRLLEFVENDATAQVVRGELLRQLGRFDEAVAVLKAVVPDGRSEVRAVRIERLASARIAALQPL